MDEESTYFSDREQGATPATRDQINDAFWRGLVAHLDSLVGRNFLAERYPLLCPDEDKCLPYSVDREALGDALAAEVPGAPWPLRSDVAADTAVTMDIVEFFHRHVSEPVQEGYHDFFSHKHILHFGNRDRARADYREQINLLFRRNRLAFELDGRGMVQRLGPPVLREALAKATFSTGDSQLDGLLEAAKTKFGDPDPTVRNDALEKLWDGWERLKTVEPGDKKQSAESLLEKAVPDEALRERIKVEADALTKIGNEFMIRHHETNKHPLRESEYIDYLFHRMFALIWLLLKRTQRLT